MSADFGQRAEDLAVHVIGPMILGGPMRLLRPFGAKLALAIGAGRRVVDNELRACIDTARLRVARSVVATDVMHELSAIEWALGCALNDLLQITNHELSSFATRGRHGELCDAVHALCAQIPPCRTLDEALGRHATFSRALEIGRTDTQLKWWTGSDSFRGQAPPARLMAWPGLRNVQERRSTVALADMAPGSAIAVDAYHDVLAHWLSCSPLSDIATADREAPAFRWSTHTVSLVATVAGSNLALRALSHATNDDARAAEAAVVAMQRSAEALPDSAGKNIARQFAAWLDEAKSHWAETA